MLAATAAIGSGSLLKSSTLWGDEKDRGPNDVLRIAVIGTGGRGKEHIEEFHSRPGCEITVLCDADTQRSNHFADFIKEKTGKRPEVVQDLRKVMDNKDVDAVSTATPNHWHALVAIWAMQAGKDVYVEKPVSHNVLEGRIR